ncbi:MAG: reverse transcriptase domain-containing protein [Eubacteriales bacterium]|nr:reverse transcriptase domain-containing protein [Eubacteriales bacterium]
MFYITVKQPPMYHQMTLEEFLFGTDVSDQMLSSNLSNTKTYEFDRISNRFLDTIDVQELIQVLTVFNEQTKTLREKPRHDLYREFHIPKKSGGLRKIDAPEPELMDALRRLKTIFEEDFKALYHTSAFAYIKHRSIIDCVKRHQANESKWFGKYDLSNFFGSTTPEFVLHMFSMVFPFSEIMKDEIGRQEFETAISLAFLDGGLPQGTPISPTITNIMMIPVDFKLANGFRDFNDQRFIYTRYADDFQVSSKYTFSFREVEKFISDTLHEFGAPFQINSSKTRYGSSAGSNWNLGIMLNKDNEITVGYKKKKQFQAMLSSYIMDRKNGVVWDKSDIQTMDGYRNYYRMVEGDTIDKMVEHIGQKFGVNVVQMIKQDLRG